MEKEYTDRLVSRFLRYVSFDTQSSEEAAEGSCPSTPKQMLLAQYLRDELKEMKLEED